MGRLQALAVLGLFLAPVGCEEKAKPTAAPKARSQGVEAVGTAAAATTAAPAAVPASAAVPAAEKLVLCAQQLGRPPKDAPKAPLSHAGKVALADKLPLSQGAEGHWTWVNLWAAWCVPCKEEIPRLKSWEQRAVSERTTLKVAFVSMDDDARQLEKFLGAQPESGLTSTYWLKDGPERAAWLKEAGYASEPELPAHILIDPEGKIRCRQQGAIEDADFPEVLKILRGERGGQGAGKGGQGKHGHASAKNP
jgi:thiol-disulfide isomerase/thioredoxin